MVHIQTHLEVTSAIVCIAIVAFAFLLWACMGSEKEKVCENLAIADSKWQEKLRNLKKNTRELYL